ncbi:MAG: hypothetical protein BRD57_00295, partial [Proteobacteria bacterium SW_6_67_9]
AYLVYTMGGITLLVGLIIWAVFLDNVIRSSGGDGEWLAWLMFALFAGGLLLVLLGLFWLHLWIARAIWYERDAGQAAGVIYAVVVLLPGFPIGTALGALMLWWLLRKWSPELSDHEQA